MNAELIARLIEAGTPAALVAEVATELARAQVAIETLENRKAKDRQRKRSTEIHGTPRKSEEDAEIRNTLSPQSPPLKNTPDPKKYTPPLTPQSEDSSAEPTAKPLTKREVIEAWQERMVPQGFPAIRKMTGQRERQLTARLRDSTLDEWLQAMSALERSAFCRGENDRGWRADFDFLLQPRSFTKLLEGAYDH